MPRKGKHSELGEVYTPPKIIQSMIDELKNEINCNEEDFKSKTHTWLEPGFGDGRILYRLKEILLSYGHSEENVLNRLYGIEINPESCKKGILKLYGEGELTEITNQHSKVRRWRHSKWGDVNNLVCSNLFDYEHNFGNTVNLFGNSLFEIEE